MALTKERGNYMNEIEREDGRELTTHEGENSFLTVMERLVTSKEVDAAKIEKMMDLQERILNRNAKQEYMAAFAEMQPEIPSVIKTGRTNNATYAKYEKIVESIQPILGKHGFGFSHRVNQSNGQIEVVCILSHRGGHSEETQFIAPADTSGSKNSVQAIGSTVSYGKRYTLNALLGISTKDEDNDDNGAVVENEKAVEVDQLIIATGTKKDQFLTMFGISDVRDLLEKDYKTAKRFLELKKGAKKNG